MNYIYYNTTHFFSKDLLSICSFHGTEQVSCIHNSAPSLRPSKSSRPRIADSAERFA